MTKKPTVTTLASGFNSTETLNANFEALRDGFDNTLSLDGSTPNAMEADLDLNGNNIIGAAGLLINGTDYLSDVEAAKAAALAAQAAAETAETNAETAETNAESSETAAASSATAASTSATASAASAVDATNNGAAQVALATVQAALATTNGAAQVNLAAAQVTLATTAKTAAELAETNAETAESNAATSATNAATSATTASTGASTASTKASEAATSATNSATSATESETAKTAAEAAKDAALAALDNFDDRYLGSKASDPTLDNDGNALVAGALYYNTTDDVMKVYTGSVWVAAYASLSGALLTTNNLSDVVNVSSSRTNLGLGTTDSPTFAGLTTTGNVSFGDNDKALFGAGSDLQIFHNGSNSYVQDNGTGLLIVQGSSGVHIQGRDATDMIRANEGSGVQLYHNDIQKLATTTTGASLTGNLTATGTVTAAELELESAVPRITLTDTDGTNQFTTISEAFGNTFYISRNDATKGQHIFQQVAGGVYTEAMRINTSGNVQITGSVTAGDVNITGPTPILTLTDNDVADEYTKIQNSGGATFIDSRNGTGNGPIILRGQGGGVTDEYARFISNGKFGINTTSPEDLLDISRLGATWSGPTTGTTSVALFHSGGTGTGSGAAITIGGGTAAPCEIYFADLDDADVGKIRYDHADNSMAFHTNNSERMVIDSAGNLTATGSVTAGDVTLSKTTPLIGTSGTTGYLTISGDTAGALGANLRLYGSAHATLADDILFRNDTTTVLQYNASVPEWNFQANNITTTGSVTSDTGLLAGAGAAAGAVGTYAFLIRNTAYVVFGSTYGGGGLRPAGLSSTAIISTTDAYYHDDESADLYVGPGTATANTSGTWRCMGQVTTVTGMDRGVTLFLRIA